MFILMRERERREGSQARENGQWESRDGNKLCLLWTLCKFLFLVSSPHVYVCMCVLLWKREKKRKHMRCASLRACAHARGTKWGLLCAQVCYCFLLYRLYLFCNVLYF
uniref:Putative serpentine type 7tm gpcr chemoreceptor srz n=1 Tax=Ixodes ricinus TaxID=34613 RepID=A0A131Y832_IXORI